MTPAARTCGGCAWAEADPAGWTCARSAPSGGRGILPITAADPACPAWEAPLDCATCGACCRQAFDAVPVEPEDLLTRTHLAADLVVHSDGWTELRRVACPGGTCCSQLDGDGVRTPYRCRSYAWRATACRDLEPGTANCLLARQRVGLSP